MILAFFHMCGNCPSSSDFMKMMLTGIASVSAVSERRVVGMSSGPAALLFFKFFRSFCTSATSTSMSVSGLLNSLSGASGR